MPKIDKMGLWKVYEKSMRKLVNFQSPKSLKNEYIYID